MSATNVDTGLVRSSVSNSDGAYSLPNLPVGHYKLDVVAVGFKEYIQSGITLQVNESPVVNVSLALGAVSEKMEVTGNAVMVDTHENSISTVIDNNRIMELPLDGRNAPALILLSGGAANVALSSNDLNSSKNYGNGNSANSSPTVTISVGGSQENANNYLLDGSDNNDAFSNVNAPFPFPDAIQEFSVQSSGLSARYGVHAGAVVNVVTKSGTNSFHGDVFEFLRNPLLNAHHVQFTAPQPGARDDTIKRNQFGGTIGGPIIKDKLMFFAGPPGNAAGCYASAQEHHRAYGGRYCRRFQHHDVGGLPEQWQGQNPQGAVHRQSNRPCELQSPGAGIAEIYPGGDQSVREYQLYHSRHFE